MVNTKLDSTFILNKEDVNNPLYPNLWESLLETIGVVPGATEVYVERSELDHNKTIKE